LVSLILLTGSLLLSQGAAEAKTPLPPERLRLLANHVAEQTGMDANLLLAVAYVESHYNPRKTGSLGEVGLMQLRPEFHDGVDYSVIGNLTMAANYMKELRVICKHKADLTWLTCYNAGPYNKISQPKQTAYYKAVLAAYTEISK
jgi:soluble lytic murein transglycosylase-like protein